MKRLLLYVVSGLMLTAGFVYAQSPTIITGDVDNRTESSAQLNGEALLTSEYPFGIVFFEYGRTTDYGSRTREQRLTQSQTFTSEVRNLRADLSYEYRAVLVGSDGRVFYGANRDFITTPDNIENPPIPPVQDPLITGTSTATSTVDNTDSDNDGVPDSEECPGQENGAICPDTDNDGDPDYLDVDSDNDGIADGEDPARTDPFNSNTGETPTTGGGVTVGGPGLGSGGSLIPNGSGDSDPLIIPDADFDPDELVPCDGAECGFDDFVQLIQNVIQYLIYLTALMLVAAIMFAGWKIFVQGDKADARKVAKDTLSNAVKGLALALFAFILVNTALGILTDTDTTREFIEGETQPLR